MPTLIATLRLDQPFPRNLLKTDFPLKMIKTIELRREPVSKVLSEW